MKKFLYYFLIWCILWGILDLAMALASLWRRDYGSFFFWLANALIQGGCAGITYRNHKETA